ncbi:hypothetical protein GZ78_03910 [Endozoicomonas numazuensis]|uniref:Uncharacterized protein n=1 Tax=Endozoicomonas numazuensis TaxID=1137799 RepID=A0A081NL31_9GAMM|nr:hypothetical protein GZ78_03910 [Endozoicomonas numazuensis]
MLAATAGTGLRGSKPLVDLHQMVTRLFRFVVELCYKGVPPCISYGSGKTMILEHVFDLQRLYNQRFVFVNELSGKFVLKVIAGKGYTLMRLCYE